MMKNRVLQTAALLTMGACVAAAQNGPTTPMPATPAQQAAKLVARLTALLDLTATEQTSATPIFTTEFTTLATVRTNLESAETAIAGDIKNNNTSGIATDAQTIGTLTQQAVEARATAGAAFFALLSSAQQTKLESLKGLGLLNGFGGFAARGGLASGGYGRR